MKPDRIIILAAGQGSRLRPLTDNLPKCMVPIHGKPLLYWHLNILRRIGFKNIIVVGGYRLDQIEFPDITLLENREFGTTNMVATLWLARDYFADGFVLAYGDILYNLDVLSALLVTPHDISVVIDRKWHSYWQKRVDNVLDDAESLKVDQQGRIVSIGQKVTDARDIDGQYIGLLAFKEGGVHKLVDLMRRERAANAAGVNIAHHSRPFRQLFMTDLMQRLIDEGNEVRPVWIDGGWVEIDTLSDLDLAKQLCLVSNRALLIRR
jgi:L-glutamine-phosphate cytidylyltransferase